MYQRYPLWNYRHFNLIALEFNLMLYIYMEYTPPNLPTALPIVHLPPYIQTYMMAFVDQSWSINYVESIRLTHRTYERTLLPVWSYDLEQSITILTDRTCCTCIHTTKNVPVVHYTHNTDLPVIHYTHNEYLPVRTRCPALRCFISISFPF